MGTHFTHAMVLHAKINGVVFYDNFKQIHDCMQSTGDSETYAIGI
jgi:hypothetical protein